MNGPRLFGCLLAIGVLMTPTLVAAAGGCSFYDNNERHAKAPIGETA